MRLARRKLAGGCQPMRIVIVLIITLAVVLALASKAN
jgi:hypothetical protein